jgi:hypothetical protein
MPYGTFCIEYSLYIYFVISVSVLLHASGKILSGQTLGYLVNIYRQKLLHYMLFDATLFVSPI